MRRLSGVRRLVQGLNRTTPRAPVQTLSPFFVPLADTLMSQVA
jgi:hypothetical protein